MRATRRLKWPGEAAVTVSVVHVIKGPWRSPVLDGRQVRRVSAYLVEGDLDTSPTPLAENAGKAFQGSIVLGMGFTFDDEAAEKGVASSLEDMRRLIEKDDRNAERIRPYLGGEEVNTHPSHAYHRFAIDFFDRPLRRDASFRSWMIMSPREREACLAGCAVPADYPGEVAEDWPDLVGIVRERVKPERDLQKRDALRARWWQYAEKRPGLYRTITPLTHVIVRSLTSAHFATFVMIESRNILDQTLIVFATDKFETFATLTSRSHEVWVERLGATLEDRGRYSIADCFRPFPFPATDAVLRTAGEVYHSCRSALMIERNEGLTKTYNRFHTRRETAPDIVRLRELHASMDAAVLAAYGWNDLADSARPEFIEQDADDGKVPKTRLDWPAALKDEVLTRLLALNAERAAAERVAGLSPAADDDDLNDEDEAA